MRVVLDTNVLVAAQRSPSGASARILDAVRDRRITPVVSTALFLEYEAVLTRPEHLAPRGLSESDVRGALAALASVAEPASASFVWRPLARDPDDDMVLEAAINGAAEAIVTFETATFQPGEAFGIAIMTPAAFWGKIKL